MTCCLLALFAVVAADAGVQGEVIDFTDEDGIAGGDEYTAAPPEPIEHESLMPDRYRGPVDAGPAPAPPEAPHKRGCGGCAAGTAGGSPLLMLFALYAARMRSQLIGRLLVVAVLVCAVGCGKKKTNDDGQAKPADDTKPAAPDPQPEIVTATDESGGVVMVPGLAPQPMIPDDSDPATPKSRDPAVVGVTLAGDAIYFLDQRIGGVVRQPLAGGKAKVLGEFKAAMSWASAGDERVFFLAGGSLRSVPIKGGKLALVANDLMSPRGIAADGDAVYVAYGKSFGAGPSGPDGVVARYDAAGKPTMIADKQPGPIAVAVDATHVYWTAKGGLMRAAKAGGVAETVADLGDQYAWHLALSDTHAYITVQGNAGTHISQVAKADGTVKQLARLHNQPVDIAWGDKLYFTAESATPAVATLWSFDPADSKLTSIATGLTGRPYLEASTTHIAWANADTVYWVKLGETKPNTVRLEPK